MGTWGVGPIDNDASADIIGLTQDKFLHRAITLLSRFLRGKPVKNQVIRGDGRGGFTPGREGLFMENNDLVQQGLAYAMMAIRLDELLDDVEGKKLVGLIRKVAATDEGFDVRAKRREALLKFSALVNAKVHVPKTKR